MTKIVGFSDPHWDRVTLGVPRFDDLVDASDQAVDYAIAQKADLVLLLGDIADPDTLWTYLASAKAVETGLRCRAGGASFRALVGNHDVSEIGRLSSTLSPLAELDVPGIAVYEEPAVECFEFGDGPFWIVALPFTPRSNAYDPERFVREAALKIPKGSRCIVIGHLNLEGIGPGSETIDMPRGREVFWPLDAIAEAFAGHDVLMLAGHYHERQIFRGVHVVGSIGRMTLGEERLEPSFFCVEF